MWGTLAFGVALCLVGNAGVSGDGVMGRLHWCSTLCMCRESTQVEVQCFERSDIYRLLEFKRIQVFKLEKTNWKLENQLMWCNNTCLCHQNNNPKVFKCVDENSLKQFISDKIGDEYFYVDEEHVEGSGRDMDAEEEQDKEEARELEQRRRSEERRKNRRKGKPRKRVKNKPELPREIVTQPPTTTLSTPSTTEVVEMATNPPTEAVLVTTPPLQILAFWDSPGSPAPEILLTSGAPMTVTEQTIPYQSPQHDPIDTEIMEEEEEEEEEEEDQQEYDEEEDAEPLPKQEAVAASPAVTAMQPPTRHQPFSPTASSHAATREAETLAPKVSAVLEVPIQRKTVASEVSQDLDELGSAVMQIKSDVVLNQKILLVTVAVAAIAMLGVIVLAVHSCLASKRQAAAEERRLKESPKEDNHVTKVNLEEAW